MEEFVHQRAHRDGGKVECNFKKCEGTRFHTLSVQWLALKQDEEFANSFNIKLIECMEARLTKVMQDMEALENKKRSYDSIFKGIQKQHFNKRRRKKENRRTRQQTENNVQ